MTASASNFFDTVEKVFHDWHYDHPRILYALMRSLKPEVAVEVGTYRGYAACYMAQAIKENGKGRLFCIDDFSEGTQKQYDARHWHDNLVACEVREFATLLIGKSSEVKWPEKVDFAYIDGWHGYTSVVLDFEECAARGAECVCLDDATTTVGPMMTAEDVRRSGMWDVLDLHRDCGLSICVRIKGHQRPRFSQELPGHPGVDLRELTPSQLREHFAEAKNHNGIDYDSVQ